MIRRRDRVFGTTKRVFRSPILQRRTGWIKVGGIILAATALALLCLLYLWQGTTIRELTAQVEGARDKLVAVEEVNRWLEFQIGKAFSLERIARVAREKLGMVEPIDIRYVRVRIEG